MSSNIHEQLFDILARNDDRDQAELELSRLWSQHTVAERLAVSDAMLLDQTDAARRTLIELAKRFGPEVTAQIMIDIATARAANGLDDEIDDARGE